MGKALFAALMLLALASVRAEKSIEGEQCFNKINHFLITYVASGPVNFCRAMNDELSAFVMKTCSWNVADWFGKNFVSAVKKALNDVICKPSSDQCSMKQKIRCNSLLYEGSGVGAIPDDVNNQMPEFLQKVGPGLANGNGLSRFCRMRKPDNYYKNRTKCLREADANIYKNCLPYITTDLKEGFKHLFNTVYLNLGPPAAPKCPGYLEGGDQMMCNLTCAETFEKGIDTAAYCMKDFLSNYNNRMYPPPKSECRAFDKLNGCMKVAFRQCSLVEGFTGPGLAAINYTLPQCSKPPPLKPWDKCFRKVIFYLIKKTAGGAEKFCDGLSDALENYVKKSCEYDPAHQMKRYLFPKFTKAMDDIICNPTRECSLKMKLNCHSLLYRRSGLGAIPYNVNDQMPRFIDRMGSALMDEAGISRFCQMSKPANHYEDTAKCLKEADANITACLPQASEDLKYYLTKMFNLAFFTLGPPKAPRCAETLEEGDMMMCKSTCPMGFKDASYRLYHCLKKFNENFAGKTYYPKMEHECRMAGMLGHCTDMVFKRCNMMRLFSKQSTMLMDKIFMHCTPDKSKMAGATAVKSTIGLIAALVLALKLFI